MRKRLVCWWPVSARCDGVVEPVENQRRVLDGSKGILTVERRRIEEF
jgi:hypothetical protein